MKKIIFLVYNGIAMGCVISCFITILGVLIAGDSFLYTSSELYIKQILAAMIVGIGFSVPSLAYRNEKWSKGIQTLVHMGTGLMIYFVIAFRVNWIPTKYGIGMMIGTILYVLLISFAIWSGFYLYYKAEAKKINQRIKEMNL